MEQIRRRVGQTTGLVSDAGQRRHRPDYQIILFVGLLMLIGLIMMYAIGPQRANVLNSIHKTSFYTDTYFVNKQTISLLISVAAFVLMARLPFEVMKRYAWRLVQIGFALCALLFVGGNLMHIDAIAVNTLGAYRWFNLGPLGSFQPAEVLKLALLIFIAAFLGKRYAEGKVSNTSDSVYPVVGLAAVALFIVIVLQKDMGTGVSIAATVFSMLIVSGMKWRVIGQISLVAAALGILMVVTSPHRMERVATFFRGDHAASQSAKESDDNYHIKNAMIALGTGGFLGLGIGHSVQATGYLPEAINDSVFAIIGETFGFVGVVVILLLFTALLLRLLRITDYLSDMSMRLAVAGVFGWLVSHVVLNIASMIGLVPLTGITLPLLSFGGTSMVFIAGALGLAFQLSRYTSHRAVEIKGASDEDSRSRRGIGGSRYSRRRRTQAY